MSTAYVGTVLTDTPVAYWRLGEPSGTTAYDASGSAFHGTYGGTVTLNQAATPIKSDNNTSALFDGSTGNVAIPAGLSTAGYSGFSVECWVKLANTTFVQNPRLIANSHTDSDNKGFELYIQKSANSFNMTIGNGSTFANANWVTTLDTNWHHVIGTWNGTTITLYVDGTSRATASLSGTMGTPSSAIALGYADTYNGDFLPGSLDECAIYNYALTGTQVTNHFNAAAAVNFNLYQIPPYPKNRVIQPEDINQVIYTLHQPTGGQEIGHYILASNAYILNATMGWYVSSLSRGSTPVSVTLDASDITNSGMTASPASNDHLTANGFHIFDFAATGPQTNAIIGGKYTIQY